MRALTTAVALLSAVALGGCQADSEPGSRPSEDPTTTPTTTPSTPDAAPEPPGDPLRFFSIGGRTQVSCFPDGPRRLMSFDQVRPRRPVTLTGVTGGGRATRITGTWVAPLDPKEIEDSGNLDLDAGGTQLTDIEGWADREPLRGADLEPGTTYTFFLRTTLRPDLPLDDFRFTWDDGSTIGRSTFDNAGRTRSGGC